MFGGQPSSSPFGTPSSTPAFGTPTFGTPSSTPAFGTPGFGTPSSTPAFGASSTPGFGSSLFSTPFSSQQQQQQQQQQPQPMPFFPQSPQPQPQPMPFFPQSPQPQPQPMPFFQQSPSTGFGFQNSHSAPQPSPFPNAQLTTQMANVAPVPFSLADRDVQAIVDAYKEDPGNPKYAFKHLLFSVTEPQYKVKPAGVSDIMWAEAMGKLEGMESADRERLWPQLVQGFKDLSQRLKIQDEVIVSDAERLRITQSNVKMLQRHFQADTLPWIQRLKQKEQILQQRLLRVMRIVEALEGKGCRIPLTKGEAELAEKLATITRQLKGSGAELSRRVQNLLTVSRVKANSNGFGCSVYLPGSTKINEQSLAALQEVLQQQMEAIARLGSVLKRDVRDMEIMMAEDTGTTENGNLI